MNLSQIRVIGFDIDKTLIFGPGADQFYSQYSSALESVFARELSITQSEAKECLDTYRKAHDGRGELAFGAFGLSETHVYDAICSLNPAGAIPIMADTHALLQYLRPRAVLIAITDGPIDQAFRLFAAAGIQHEWFAEIIGWQRGNEKPKNGSPAVFRDVIGRYNIRPEEFLMIGDTHSVDIAPVKNIGAQAIHIGNTPESITSIPKLLNVFLSNPL